MGFLNEQNKKAVEGHIFGLLKDLKAMRNGIGLNGNGINWLGDVALAHFDQFGKIDLRRVIELADEARSYAVFHDSYPHPGDPQLKGITSIEAARALSVEQLKMLNNNVAFSTGLHKRFNERLAWLQANNVHEVKPAEPEPAAPVVLTPEQQAQADARKRLDAVYAKIDKAGGRDWEQKTIQFRLWLKNKVTELRREGRGINFIEEHIDKAIRKHELGTIG